MEDEEVMPLQDPPGHLNSIPIFNASYHIKQANLRAELPANFFLELDKDCVELVYSGSAMQLVPPDAAKLIGRGECLVFKIDDPKKKKMGIESDTDLLTPQEIVHHDEEVQAPTVDELKTWLKYECFSRES